MSLGPDQNGGLNQPSCTGEDSGNTTLISVKYLHNRLKVHKLALLKFIYDMPDIIIIAMVLDRYQFYTSTTYNFILKKFNISC
jgi:hypothetical protein